MGDDVTRFIEQATCPVKGTTQSPRKLPPEGGSSRKSQSIACYAASRFTQRPKPEWIVVSPGLSIVQGGEGRHELQVLSWDPEGWDLGSSGFPATRD